MVRNGGVLAPAFPASTRPVGDSGCQAGCLSSRAGGGLVTTAFAFGVPMIVNQSPCSISVPCQGRCLLAPEIVTLGLMGAPRCPGQGSRKASALASGASEAGSGAGRQSQPQGTGGSLQCSHRGPSPSRRGRLHKGIPWPGDPPKVSQLYILQLAVLSLLFAILSGSGAALYTTSLVEQGWPVHQQDLQLCSMADW